MDNIAERDGRPRIPPHRRLIKGRTSEIENVESIPPHRRLIKCREGAKPPCRTHPAA